MTVKVAEATCVAVITAHNKPYAEITRRKEARALDLAKNTRFLLGPFTKATLEVLISYGSQV